MSESRSMPPDVRGVLEKIAATGVKMFDGRRKDWGPLEYLCSLGWVERVDADHKNPLARSYQVTDRGRYAMERERRGVDPYLRMTA